MDNKECTAAANALIEWFNSQEISQGDAKLVMAKVLAKIMIRTPTDTIEMRAIFDAFIVRLADEANNQAYRTIHRGRPHER